MVAEPEEEGSFKCDICPHVATTKSILRMHISQVHMNLKEYKCEFCELCFSYRKELHVHKLVREE